jgi:hypothetical protein
MIEIRPTLVVVASSVFTLAAPANHDLGSLLLARLRHNVSGVRTGEDLSSLRSSC